MDPGPGELGGHVMTGRDGYPAGVPCWVDTEQPDPVAATIWPSSVAMKYRSSEPGAVRSSKSHPNSGP